MILKCSVLFIIINVVSCMRSIQKIPPKYNIQSSKDLVTLSLPSDKTSFPNVVYPTTIFDIANPYYFNTDNNCEVLGPFSEDVKSAYKLLSSIVKSSTKNSKGKVKNQTEFNEVVTNPDTCAANIVSVEKNTTEENQNVSKENCVNLEVIEEVIGTQNNSNILLGNMAQNLDLYNLSLLQKTQNKSCSKIPLLVKINIQVFKEHPNRSTEEKVTEIPNLSSQNNEENTKHLKQVTNISRNEYSEEINSSSEEHFTELQDIKHSDFIKMISVLLSDLLVSTENATSEILNTTSIDNKSLERIVLKSADNLTNLEPFGLMETNVTDSELNGTHGDFENLLNLTKPLNWSELTVSETHSDFENLLNLTEVLNLIDLTVNETHNDFKTLFHLSDLLNLTDLTVNETSNDFENLSNLTELLNLTDLTISETHNDFDDLFQMIEPLNLSDLTVSETPNDFENLSNLSELLNLTDLTVNKTPNDFENLSNLSELLNPTDLTVNETPNDFENLSNLSELLNLTDLTVNETPNDFENLSNLSEQLNLTDLTVNETSNDFENLSNLTELINLTDLTVSETHNDFDNLLHLTEPLNLIDLTVNETFNDFENLLNLTELLNLMDLTVNETPNDFENMSNLTEPFRHSDGESSKDSKEDYFLEFVISLDSLCDNNKTLETGADSEYLANHEYLLYENHMVI